MGRPSLGIECALTDHRDSALGEALTGREEGRKLTEDHGELLETFLIW